MNDQRNSGRDLEELIRAALADDLPAEVEAGMRERVRRFRTDPGRGARPSVAWAFLARRAVWAALSILMVVAGFLLQGAGTGSPLADRISSVKTAYASLEPPRR